MDSAPSTPSAPVTMETEEAAIVARNPRLQQLRAQLKSHLATFHEKIRDRRTELVELIGEDFAAGLKKVSRNGFGGRMRDGRY